MRQMPPQMLSAEDWLAELFAARAARDGAVVRRSARNVEKFVGRERFLEEMRRRGFPVVENAGQMLVFCNQEPIRRLA